MTKKTFIQSFWRIMSALALISVVVFLLALPFGIFNIFVVVSCMTTLVFASPFLMRFCGQTKPRRQLCALLLMKAELLLIVWLELIRTFYHKIPPENFPVITTKGPIFFTPIEFTYLSVFFIPFLIVLMYIWPSTKRPLWHKVIFYAWVLLCYGGFLFWSSDLLATVLSTGGELLNIAFGVFTQISLNQALVYPVILIVSGILFSFQKIRQFLLSNASWFLLFFAFLELLFLEKVPDHILCLSGFMLCPSPADLCIMFTIFLSIFTNLAYYVFTKITKKKQWQKITENILTGVIYLLFVLGMGLIGVQAIVSGYAY